MAEVLSRNNPWAGEGKCPRKGYSPCWGRRWLAAQEEKEDIEKVTGKAMKKEGGEEQPLMEKRKIKQSFNLKFIHSTIHNRLNLN